MHPPSPPFYTPLRDPKFAIFWCAAFGSLVATWMHEIGSAWFMREMTQADPFMVSLVQAAMFLPVMLLSYPLGTVGDLMDRRRFLAVAHAGLVVVVAMLWFAAEWQVMTPAILLGLSVALGVGKAITLTGFAAMVPSLVSRTHLPLGVGLFSMANNAARILAPAAAGFMLVFSGVSLVYGISLLMLVIAMLLLVPKTTPLTQLRPPGSFRSELKAGLVFAYRDVAFRRIIARVAVFFLCASSLHALLPVMVPNASTYGIAWGVYGAGALLGAMIFPLVSHRMQSATQLTSGILAHALLIAGLATAGATVLQIPLLLLLGIAWFQVMAGAQVAAQLALPEALRARGMGLFTGVMMAGFGFGAPAWGLLASWTTPHISILCSGLVSVAALALTHRLQVPAAQRLPGA